jgi:hypothetical protein
MIPSLVQCLTRRATPKLQAAVQRPSTGLGEQVSKLVARTTQNYFHQAHNTPGSLGRNVPPGYSSTSPATPLPQRPRCCKVPPH